MSFAQPELDALKLFDGGVPVLVENKQLRGLLLDHRWGRHSYHEPLANDPCPACRRNRLCQLREQSAQSLNSLVDGAVKS